VESNSSNLYPNNIELTNRFLLYYYTDVLPWLWPGGDIYFLNNKFIFFTQSFLTIKGNLSICDQAIKLGVTQLCISDTPSVPIGKYLTYEEATLLIQESGKKLLS